MDAWILLALQNGSLAQGGVPLDEEAIRTRTLEWEAVLLVVVVVGFLGIMVLRRYFREPSGSNAQDAGFSLSELKAMCERGEISAEEYQRAREKVIAKVKGTLRANEAEGPDGSAHPEEKR